MEEKIFNLLEKMYNEMNEMRKDIQNNTQRMDKLETDLTQKMDNLQNNIVRLENDLTPKIKALFDGYIQKTDMLHRIEDKVDHLTKRVEKQEVEIKVIKSIN